MYGNNEVGQFSQLRKLAIVKEHQAFFHTDAVQAYGVEDIDVNVLDRLIICFCS